MFISIGLKLFESCLSKITFYVTLCQPDSTFLVIYLTYVYRLEKQKQTSKQKKSDMIQQQQSFRGFLRDSNPIFHEQNFTMVVWLYKTHYKNTIPLSQSPTTIPETHPPNHNLICIFLKRPHQTKQCSCNLFCLNIPGLLHIDYVASYIIFKSSSLDEALVVKYTHLLRCCFPPVDDHT